MTTGTSWDGSGDVFTLSLPPSPAFVSIARLFAASVARHYEIEDDRVGDLKIAISEAFTNALKAHIRAGIDDPVLLSVSYHQSGLLFEVSDSGRGFEAPVDLGTSHTPPSGLFEGSLGLILIRSLFENAEIVPNPSGGVTVRVELALQATAER